MANPTLLDIAKRNGADAVAGVIEESVEANPEIQAIPARTISGTSYQCLIRVSPPTVGFRKANEGATAVISSWKNSLVETFIMDAPTEVDKAVADASEDGPDAFISDQAVGVLEGAFRAAASQMYYGTASTFASSQAGTASDGYPGLQSTVNSDFVVDATGTTSSTGSSVWILKTGPQYIQWVIGRDGEMNTGDVQEVRLTDSSSKPYDGFRVPFLAYLGIQLVNKNSAVQIKNLTEDAGKGLTDDLIAQAMEKFPSGANPDCIFMTKRSQRQLRVSRTATTTTGAYQIQPTEFDGIPIYPTDAIVDTETIV